MIGLWPTQRHNLCQRGAAFALSPLQKSTLLYYVYPSLALKFYLQTRAPTGAGARSVARRGSVAAPAAVQTVFALGAITEI